MTTESAVASVASEHAQVISGLRQLADFLDAHPDIQVRDQMITVIHYVCTKEALSTLARGASWRKSLNDSFYTLDKDFGGGVHLHIYTDRAQVCRRVVKGTRVVEAVPAQPERTEEIIEWVCEDALLSTTERHPKAGA